MNLNSTVEIMELRKFCCIDPERVALLEPFTQGNMTWATNGFIAIGVPALPDVAVNISAPYMSKVGGHEPSEWFDVPAVEIESCKVCHGKITDIDCFECKGNGSVQLMNQYSKGKTIYEGITCGTCEGEGRLGLCPFCSGTGIDSDGLIRIGEAKFKGSALWLIKDLPGIQIAPTGPVSPAWLRFDGGGVGYLMPGVDNRSGEICNATILTEKEKRPA